MRFYKHSFYDCAGSCGDSDSGCHDKVDSVVSEFEDINDDIEDSAGILLVVNRERRLAKASCGAVRLPALALFKNGAEHCSLFGGGAADLESSAVAALNWLTDVETMEIDGKIENVNGDMLANVIESEDDVLVFFHDTQWVVF